MIRDIDDGTTPNKSVTVSGITRALDVGTAAAPAIAFATDKNTGIYSPGADQVSFATGGTERLRVDSTGQIEAVSLGTAAAPTYSFTTDPNTGIYSPGADQVAISTNGTGRLFVDASGNVVVNLGTGSGLVAAQTGFSVIGGATVTDPEPGIISIGSNHNGITSGQVLGRIRFHSNDASTSLAGTVARIECIATSTFAAGTAPTALTFFTNSGIAGGESERLRITSAGLVGVGNSSPLSLVHIGTTNAATDVPVPTGNFLLIRGGGYNNITTAGIQLSSGYGDANRIGAFNIKTIGAGSGNGFTTDLTISTQGSFSGTEVERFRIDSSGRVGIGTSAPNSLLEIRGTDEDGKLTLSNSNTGVVPGNILGSILFRNYDISLNTNAFVGNVASVAAIAESDYQGTNGARAGIAFSTNDITRPSASGPLALIERMRLDSQGRLGIGTTSPGTALQVQDANGFIQASGGGISFNRTSGTANYINTGQAGGLLSINAADAITFGTSTTGTPAPERARIDSSGRLLVGTSSARSNFNTGTVGAQLQLEGAGGAERIFAITSSSSLATRGGALVLAHQKSGAVGGNTTLADGDQIGTISYQGNDGTNFIEGARIEAQVDGTPGANDMPGRLVFSTTADGASSPTERMRITSTGQVSIASGAAVIDTATTNAPYLALVSSPLNATGAELRMGTRTSSSSTSAGIKAIHPDGSDPDYVSIGIYVRNSGTSTDPALEIARADYQGSFRPGADNARPLGNASFRWSEVFAGTGTINTSDETLKENIQDFEQAELSVAAEIKSLIKRFRFKDAVASKGDDARIHVGVIAQEVEQAFVNNGLDPRRYALFCEDTLEDGSKRLGIRYDELLAFVIAAL